MTLNYALVLLKIIFPVIAGYLAKALLNLLKRMSGAVDNSPPAVKQTLVIAISVVLTFLFQFLGIQTAATSLDTLTQVDVQALLTAALAMIFHNSDKIKVLNAERSASLSRSGYRGLTNEPPEEARSKQKDY